LQLAKTGTLNEFKPYEIGIAKLSNKKHQYQFVLDDAFFALFDQPLIKKGDLVANIELDKSELLISMKFDIKGEVELTCDRSLEEFMYPIDVEETVRFRFGPEDAELSDNILQITPDTQAINVAQHLFDFIGLAVPMKKLHPRYAEADDEGNEEGTLIFSTSTDKGMLEDDEPDNDADPRWDALRNLSQN
jgi:uncharacterized protein